MLTNYDYIKTMSQSEISNFISGLNGCMENSDCGKCCSLLKSFCLRETDNISSWLNEEYIGN